MAGFSRNFIIDRLRSKLVTPEEFSYDNLQAPPLNMFLSPYDIAELNSIARSLKYSAKPEVRYAEINRVMNRCGLIKFAAGTNRVVYRHPEFPDILFKVASDDVGLGDNPAEYRNQFLLKPFVCKCFEISPCGTVGVFERVNPIHSREEFLSVIDDVFELINTWLIDGEYVLADIGSKFHANFGIRTGFGVVLLDYPYVYKLDGNKLFCNRLDTKSETGHCNGIIDYDDGYNFLVCKKCGAVYKAKELEAKIKNNTIINDNGGIKMNITVRGGSNNVEKQTIKTNDMNCSAFKVTKSTMPSKPNNNDKKVVEEIKTEISVNGVNKGEVKKPKTPFVIDESLKKTETKPVESPVKAIEDALKTITENMNKIDIDTVKVDMLTRMFDSICSLNNKNISPIKAFEMYIKAAKDIFNHIEDEDSITAAHNKDLIDILNDAYAASILDNTIEAEMEGTNLTLRFMNSISTYKDVNSEEEDDPIRTIGDSITVDISAYIEAATAKYPDEAEVAVESKDVENEDEKNTHYNGVDFYDANITNLKDILPDQNKCKIILIKDHDGSYLTNSTGEIVAIDNLDNMALDNVKIVSKKWFDKTQAVVDSINDSEEDEEEIVEASTSAAGVLPPTECETIAKEEI